MGWVSASAMGGTSKGEVIDVNIHTCNPLMAKLDSTFERQERDMIAMEEHQQVFEVMLV